MRAIDLERLKEVFYGAIGESPERRTCFLAGACGTDEELRAEVARLLSEHDQAGAFLESPFRSILSVQFPVLSESPLEANQIIAGRYRIVSLIGEGGMGVVYKAEDARLPQFVALKSLRRMATGDTASLARLQREAQAASTLNHPNICTIHDVVESDGRTFIVMEYLTGRTIKEMIRSGYFDALRLGDLVGITMQIIEGLEAAHDKGIVHRDIKPANIFVTNAGLVKILDFGIAQTAHAIDIVAATADAAQVVCSSEEHLTTTGVAAGTIGYMSPEQVSAKELDTCAPPVVQSPASTFRALTRQAPAEALAAPSRLVSTREATTPWGSTQTPTVSTTASLTLSRCRAAARSLRSPLRTLPPRRHYSFPERAQSA